MDIDRFQDRAILIYLAKFCAELLRAIGALHQVHQDPIESTFGFQLHPFDCEIELGQLLIKDLLQTKPFLFGQSLGAFTFISEFNPLNQLLEGSIKPYSYGPD
jgi:hypothetical protein